MAETVNLPRDSTLRELVAVQKASIIASGNAAPLWQPRSRGKKR